VSRFKAKSRLPSPLLFESGDLVWPKRPGRFVPYRQLHDPSLNRKIWEEEKKEFFRLTDAHLTKKQLSALRNLNYREFSIRYYGGLNPSEYVPYSSRGFYIGHVGIIEVTPAGQIFVIEAVREGVVRCNYHQWLARRPKDLVWLGRLRNISASDRAKISVEAKKHVGRPYRFWSFDLNNGASFYCSKLVWLSIFRSLGLAIDGNANPKRSFWFSPKQLLFLPGISRLHDPADYARG
jgi:hypothetical protein